MYSFSCNPCWQVIYISKFCSPPLYWLYWHCHLLNVRHTRSCWILETCLRLDNVASVSGKLIFRLWNLSGVQKGKISQFYNQFKLISWALSRVTKALTSVNDEYDQSPTAELFNIHFDNLILPEGTFNKQSDKCFSCPSTGQNILFLEINNFSKIITLHLSKCFNVDVWER